MRMNLRSMAVAILVAAASVLVMSQAAGAQESDVYVNDPQPEVLGNVVLPSDAPTAVNAQGAAANVAEVQGSSLAFTGGDATALALFGAVAVAGGVGVLALRRRTSDV